VASKIKEAEEVGVVVVAEDNTTGASKISNNKTITFSNKAI